METADLEFSIVDTVESEAASREADKETTMYQLDTNINTAVERQANRVRAVKAYGSHLATEQAGPSWAVDDMGQTNPVARKATLAVAVAAPIVLLVVWGLIAH
jgi:hypothetical protein